MEMGTSDRPGLRLQVASAAARIHAHLVRRQRDGERGRVGLQQSPVEERRVFKRLLEKPQGASLPFVLDGADGDEGDEGAEEDGARHAEQGDLQAAHAARASSSFAAFVFI